MTLKITTDIFINAFAAQWKQEIANNQDDIMRLYSDNTLWTKFMLQQEGFLHRVMNKISSQLDYRLEYRTGYYTIDVLYIGGKDLLLKDDLCYPSEIHILIEHENGERVQEEMWKLIYWRAPLKVLIFYDYNDQERENSIIKKEWLQKKLEYLCTMRTDTNIFFEENIHTEYLFIIGTRRYDNELIYWRWASLNQIVPINFT